MSWLKLKEKTLILSLSVTMLLSMLHPSKTYSSQVSTSEGNRIKLDLEPDVCMSQRRYRELRKLEDNYPSAIEEIMDCRGDLMAVGSDSSSVHPMVWLSLGIVIGIMGGLNAK